MFVIELLLVRVPLENDLPLIVVVRDEYAHSFSYSCNDVTAVHHWPILLVASARQTFDVVCSACFPCGYLAMRLG